jgi:hypothetical protein
MINGGKVHVHRAEMPQAMVDKAVKKVATCLTEKMLEKVRLVETPINTWHTRLAVV